jgi:hypothetical protein
MALSIMRTTIIKQILTFIFNTKKNPPPPPQKKKKKKHIQSQLCKTNILYMTLTYNDQCAEGFFILFFFHKVECIKKI